MTKRTFVGYWRLFWSWLITGAAKDKTTLSPSCAAPSMKDEKNMGQLNMANPYIDVSANTQNLASTFGSGVNELENQTKYVQMGNSFIVNLNQFQKIIEMSMANYQSVADHNAKLGKFQKQIDAFKQLKEKRKLRLN